MARQKQRFSGAGYAALFFVLFYIIDRCLESMLFTPEQQAAHFAVSTFILALLAIVSWYLGSRLADRKGKKR